LTVNIVYYSSLTTSEMMIMITFHQLGYRDFKTYYTHLLLVTGDSIFLI